MRKRIGNKIYDTDTSQFVCHTPQGDLYKKRSSLEFFVWKTGDRDPVTVSWPDANNLVKTYGTREQYIAMFTAYDKSTDPHKGSSTQVRLSSYHRIKATRNAQRLGLSLKAYIERLIDRDDANHNYAK